MYCFYTWEKGTADLGKYQKPSSEHFIAIFKNDQEKFFKEVCKKHTCVSAVPVRGAYQGQKKYLAICVFRVGKEKQK
jgi:hypothetical protein